MSLIQDALKRKTEEQHPLPAAPQPAAPVKPAEQPAAQPSALQIPPPGSSAKKLFIILSIAVVLILLVIGASLYFYLHTPETPVEVVIGPPPAAAVKTSPPVAPPAATPAPQPVAETPKTKKTSWPDLSYSGSAVGGSQILAIINGRMLSVGDRINGVEVLQIGKTEVLVEYRGEKRVLNIDDEQ